jgi:signal peptidase I
MKIKSISQKIVLIATTATSVASVCLFITSVEASSPQLFKRIGSNFCLNAHNPRNESVVNLWQCDSNDPDQKWEKIPVTTGTTTQWIIRRVDSNFCLNAHNPGNESTVNLWQCDSNDPDQKWEEINNQMLRRAGSNFCLNAHNPGSESKVNLWQCDSNDPDQKWENIALSSIGQKFTLSEYYQKLYAHTQAASSRQWEQHKAIDSNVVGNASLAVRALVGGEVIHVKNGVKLIDVQMDNTGYHPGLKKRVKASDYNTEVIIWNADLNRRFIYLHFSEVRVGKGTKVNPGDVIGIEGSTGWSIGRHTHLEVRTSNNQNGALEDPLVTLGNARTKGILDKKYR